MASKYEHKSTGGGFSVVNNGVETGVIPQTGRTLEPVGGSVYPQVSPKGTIEAQAATADLVVDDFGKINTNTGASGTIVLTLPAAATVIGKTIKIQVTAAQIVRLLPQTGEKIYLGGDGVATKYLNIAGVIGNFADVYSDGTDYLVTNYAGVLTKEA